MQDEQLAVAAHGDVALDDVCTGIDSSALGADGILNVLAGQAAVAGDEYVANEGGDVVEGADGLGDGCVILADDAVDAVGDLGVDLGGISVSNYPDGEEHAAHVLNSVEGRDLFGDDGDLRVGSVGVLDNGQQVAALGAELGFRRLHRRCP